MVDKLTTPDDYTVVMHLKQVFAPFLSYVGGSWVLPKHSYDKPGFDFNKASFSRQPFGTGPYMVSEWKTGDHITLVPNPYSWRGQPHIKKIISKIVPNNNMDALCERLLHDYGFHASIDHHAMFGQCRAWAACTR